MKSAIRDRDMLETSEGFYFTAVGYIHPPDRVFAYLKYLPDNNTPTGIWEKDNIRFQRIIPEYSAKVVQNTFKLLSEEYPEYLFDCPINNIKMSAVPYTQIKQAYYTDNEYQRILQKTNRDSLEAKVAHLAYLIKDHFNLKQDELGITGSIALQIHHPRFSDIDLIVYGRENTIKLSRGIHDFILSTSLLNPLSNHDYTAIIQRKARLFGLDIQPTKLLIDRKWNTGVFDGTRFAILPVHKPEEVTEQYGNRVYHEIGNTTIVAKIIDACDSFFNPAIYRISVQKFIDGIKVPNLRSICSWEFFFANSAKEDEIVMAKGKVEQVRDIRNNETWYRLLVGSGTGDKEFIIPYRELETI